MTPRIAIPMPTSFDPAYNRANYSAYADAVRSCGGEPVEVTLGLTDQELARVALDCEGIVLPGSPADVEPALYGQMKDEATARADEPRERVDRALLDEAYRSAKPVLGICFGVQMLNVYRGGTLVQDLSVVPVNHSAGRSVAIAHSAAVDAASLLASSVDVGEGSEVDGMVRLPINSSHHQAVGIPGAGLKVSARCPQDGVVEAIEGPGPHFVLGVQWHPERSIDSSPSSRALFTRLVDEAQRMAALTPERIGELLAEYYPTPSVELVNQLSVYLELLLRWNAKTNLTAIREPEEIVRRHFGESLFVAAHLPDCATLLDLGSGAGFPGLPIQLARPGLRVTLAESQNKKAAFLREAVRTLGLSTEVWADRVERMPDQRRFDVVALRAVDNPTVALDLARLRLAAGGLIAHLTGAPGVGGTSIPVPGTDRSVLHLF